jgi:DUF2075 family protein
VALTRIGVSATTVSNKVLLTRGMLGTMVYSTDLETQELLRSLIPDSV